MSNHPWDRGFAGRVKALLYSNRGRLLRPLHGALTSTMLFGVGAMDAWRHRGEQPDARLAEDVTIAVKTFERPEAVKRFVRSARRVFDGRIVVADDSREPWRPSEPGVEVVVLPFNFGVTRGRNAALARVETPYVIVGDDDLVFTHGTDWARALDYLERNPEVDAVAPILVEVPRWYTIVFYDDQLFAKRKTPLREPGEVIDGLPVRLKTRRCTWRGLSRSAGSGGTSRSACWTTRISSAARAGNWSSCRTRRSWSSTPGRPGTGSTTATATTSRRTGATCSESGAESGYVNVTEDTHPTHATVCVCL